jgi:Na+(H+)/acetate symporter ActP
MKTATALLALLVSSAFAFSPTISRARFGTLSITTLSGQKTPFDHVMTGVVSGLTAFSLATGAFGPLLVQPVHAAESRLIGEIQGSGLIFKVSLVYCCICDAFHASTCLSKHFAFTTGYALGRIL